MASDVADVPPVARTRVDDDYLTVTMLAAGLAGILRRRSLAGQGDWPRPMACFRRRGAWLFRGCGGAVRNRVWLRRTSDLDLLAWCTHAVRRVARGLVVVWLRICRAACLSVTSCLISLSRARASAALMSRRSGRRTGSTQALRTAAQANGGDDAREDGPGLRRPAASADRLSGRVRPCACRDWEQEFDRTDGSGQTYVRRLVDAAYVPRPAAREVPLPAVPGLPQHGAGLRAACGTPGCPSGPAETVTSTTALAVVYEQHRATRRFIHDPGLVEARLLDALGGKKFAGGSGSRRIRALDALDILIEFLSAGGGERDVVDETWGADAKDQASARLLGRGFSWPGAPACGRRFLVLPTHRAGAAGLRRGPDRANWTGG